MAEQRVLYPAPDWEEIDDDLMSNLDHEVDETVAERMRHEQITARYPGWEFNALCWFEDGQFHAQVMRYGQHVDTQSAETPEQLMTLVSSEWGEG